MFWKKRTITFNVDICVEKDGDRYHAFCPALKGLHVEGETVAEACQNASDAASAYLTSMINHGTPIPISIAETACETGFDIPAEETSQKVCLLSGQAGHRERVPVTV